LAAVYFRAGRLGLKLAFVHASATPVWPPTGIALAAFLLFGSRVWPAILAGAFLVNVTTAGSVASSLEIAFGNMLEGVVGAYLVRRFAGGRNALTRASNVFRFSVLAGFLATTLSATIGVASLAATGQADWHAFWRIWQTWWLGDASGAILVAPLILIGSATWDLEWNRNRLLEACLLMASVLIAGLLVCTDVPAPWWNRHPYPFFTVPLLVWAAFRFSPREAVSAISILSGVMILGTVHGSGIFIQSSMNESLLLLQAVVIVATITTLMMAALVVEHRRTESDLRQAQGGLERKVERKTEELRQALDALKKDIIARERAEESLR